MVKGVARHAVIVKTGESKDFEQAIFILSGQQEERIKSPDELLTLACQLAEGYCADTRLTPRENRSLALPVACFLAGGGLTALLGWIILSFPLF